MIRSSKIFLSLFFVFLSITNLSMACQVPVFRYALERWESDNYQLFLVTPTALDEKQTQELLEFEKKLEHTNLELNIIDASKISEEQLWKLPPINIKVTSPTLTLYYPKSTKIKEPILTKPLTSENLDQMINSTARESLINKIVNGTSCVWLIVHQGDLESAKKTQTQLSGYLQEIEPGLTIPEGIIGTEERDKITEETDLEDVLRSKIPLKIAFDTQILDRNNPEESAFVATLLAASPPEIKDSGETLIIPIFGRARQLPPMPASKLNFDTINGGCEYLCGACSCQVKEQNPGLDLLVHEDWASYLTAGLAVVDKALPPLQGIGDLVESNATNSTKIKEQEPTANNLKPSPSPSNTASTPSPEQQANITQFIPYLIGALIAVLAVITLIKLKK